MSEATAKRAAAEEPAEAAAAPAKRSKKTQDTKAAKAAAAADNEDDSEKKYTALDLIPEGLDPTSPASFNTFLFALLAFKAANNNFHVNKEDNPPLHAWLQYLKREYKLFLSDDETHPSSLTAPHRKVLEYLHVPVTSRGDDHWNRFFKLLQAYQDRHGHVLVPRLCEVPGLGDWVTDQRRQHKAWKQGQASQLSAERRQKLESLGFVWHVRNRPEWEHRYQELIHYKEQCGDCKVPQHYKENKALGKWVAKQREQYKLLKKGLHSFLTPYRLERLNSIGFVWQVRTSMDTDTEEELRLLRMEHGRKEPPASAAKSGEEATGGDAAGSGEPEAATSGTTPVEI